MTNRKRQHGGAGRRLTVPALSVLLALVALAPVAVATDPSVPPTTVTVPPTTTSPTTTIPSPPASTTTTTAPATPTTTVPGSSTTVAPTTTVADAGGEEDPESGGFATTPAPLIPSADSDPLFHAALTVDDDLRALSLAQIDYLKRIAAARDADRAADVTQKVFDRAHTADQRARREFNAAKTLLRAAALHAYAGYGSAQTAISSPQAQGGETVLPYRTYVRVTINDATKNFVAAQASYDDEHARAKAAEAKNSRAQQRGDRARAARRAAKQTVADAKEKLERDREALADQIAAMPDLAPGTLDALPEVTKLPPGASKVMSPAGTIVVPAEANPRTVVALQFIVAQLGKPYVWGGTGPNSYDCSGLMLRAFQAAGVTSMPRVSQGQQVWATPVDAKDVRPGDLVFFGTPAYHVGVYIGGGLMIDAPYTGAHVRVDHIWSSVSGYGRVVW